MNITQETNEIELITSYFQQGITNLEMLEFLKLHGIEMSLSTLKRRLYRLGLRRRLPPHEQISQETIEPIIEHELAGSKCNVRYRKMWKHITTKYGVSVKREMVRKCLLKLDPEGVDSRRNRRLRRRAYSSLGPNHIWHIDGRDKLKPFGFIGGPIQCLVSYRDQCAHTLICHYINNIRLATLQLYIVTTTRTVRKKTS